MTRTATVLHLAYSNAAGVPGRWVQAHREAGLKADLVLEVPDEYDYGPSATVERWSLEEELPPIDAADVVMVYDSPYYLQLALDMGKQVLFRAYGSHSRRQPELVKELLTSPQVLRATAGTGDLALALDIPLVGCPFPKLRRARPEGMVAVHSPSHRVLKGTETIERVARGTGWELEIVENASHAEVLERKSRAALVVDQFGTPPHPDGTGVSALEAMAMGLPAITRVSDPVRELYLDFGCPAVFVSTEREFVAAMRRLRDPDERQKIGEEGRAWVRSFHNGADRAREDLEAIA